MSRTERSKTLNPIWHHKNYMSDTGAMSHIMSIVYSLYKLLIINLEIHFQIYSVTKVTEIYMITKVTAQCSYI